MNGYSDNLWCKASTKCGCACIHTSYRIHIRGLVVLCLQRADVEAWSVGFQLRSENSQERAEISCRCCRRTDKHEACTPSGPPLHTYTSTRTHLYICTYVRAVRGNEERVVMYFPSCTENRAERRTEWCGTVAHGAQRIVLNNFTENRAERQPSCFHCKEDCTERMYVHTYVRVSVCICMYVCDTYVCMYVCVCAYYISN